ncbi:putative metal-dependent hydrolase YcfH [Candidatus Hartigia pinicola]|nr:putative metal-dependent hydrolase YcfH [Candidatus Hartigia pinicola]
MFIVDSHCHLDCLDYEVLHINIDDVINKASLRDVKCILAVSTTLNGFDSLKVLIKKFDNIVLSCGIHPLNLNELDDFSRLESMAVCETSIALGETGLDYFSQKENFLFQKEAFRQHIRIARQVNKPIIVHTRHAKKDTLSILREEHVYDCGGVLHCFTEDKETASTLLDLGMYISFSGIITFRNAEKIREVVKFVPFDRILVETDSPYLSPTPHRGKENQPAYARDIVECIGILKGVSTEDVAQITTKNFNDLFHLNIGSTKLSLLDSIV